MSTRTEKQAGGGLSVTTLAIASASSVAAAYVIHTFWTGGAILGAGVTPVIVAIVSESLKKPTQRITAIREERRTRAQVSRRTPRDVPVAPPPELERPDPFGIWQDQDEHRFHKVRGRPLKLAIATGLLAFVVAAFVVTGADLVFGSGDGGGDRLKIVPGTQQRQADTDREDTTTTTHPAAPAETDPPAQTEPAQTVPPATTTPAEPQPTTPAPETPAPEPTPQTPTPAPAEPQG